MTKELESESVEKKRYNLKREINLLLENSWWIKKGKNFTLEELRVIKTMRTDKSIWEGNNSYMRLLTRAAVRKPSETVLERLISVIGNQARENFDWSKLLTEVQFRSFGPYAHEWDNLIDQMYTILNENDKMRCLVRHPRLRKKRSAHLKGSA